MCKQIIRHGTVALFLLICAIVPASGQEFRGSLAGRVVDPQDAVVPGATVSIKNVGTNVENTFTTREDGSYSFSLLQPGNYMLTVSKDGFTTATRDGIVIQVADKLTLDIKMEIGVSATISIMAGAPVLETGSVSTGSVITSQQISELPLTEGTAYQLATLAPGIGYTGNPLFT